MLNLRMFVRSESKPDSHNDEGALVQQAIDGDQDAFEILYNQYLEPIYRYVYFRVEDEKEAEDLTEEVFIRAWEGLPRYQHGKYPFMSWVYRIAHNLLVDYHRKRKTMQISETQLRYIGASTSSIEEQAAQNHTHGLLHQAIGKLNADEQQVILLRFIQGLSHQEISAIIGKSEGACRVIQHRALTNLSRYLKHSQTD